MFNLSGSSAQHSNLQLKLTKLLLKFEFVVSSFHYPAITGLQLEGAQILLTVIQTNMFACNTWSICAVTVMAKFVLSYLHTFACPFGLRKRQCIVTEGDPE